MPAVCLEFSDFQVDKTNPFAYVRVCVCGSHRLVVKGYRSPLQAEDLWRLREEDTSEKIISDLEEEWTTERTKLQQYEIPKHCSGLNVSQ